MRDGLTRLEPQWPRSQRGQSRTHQGYSPLTRTGSRATGREGLRVTVEHQQGSAPLRAELVVTVAFARRAKRDSYFCDVSLMLMAQC